MADEKKTPSAGPVVIRKGQIAPLPELPSSPATSEPPQAPEQRDTRPLWQRAAERRSDPARSGGAREGRSRGGAGERGRERGPRRRRDQESRSDARAERAVTQAPTLGGEPPPAPEIEAPDEGSFADMLAGTEATQRRRFQVGEKVAAKIIQIGHDVAFLDLGAGIAEGMIDVVELRDDQGEITARINDIVDGVVVKGGERGIVISKGRAQSKMSHDRDALIQAAQTGLPLEGVVKAVNKGGLEVEILGQRAFCPVSQIDLHFVSDTSVFVGQKLQFKVQRADARDAVLSRRALLEEEKAERARKTREALAEGAIFDGTVTNVQDYGAFVDLGGIEGLVHVSELSWDRVSKPSDLLKAGDAVKVQVLRIDQDPKKGERISLSVRSLTERPEPEPAVNQGAPRPAGTPPAPPKVGDVVKASIDKIEPFGLFVRFAGGRGLIPSSETGTPRGTDLHRTFKVGAEFDCYVSAIDDRGRFKLSLTEAAVAAERREAQEYMRKAAPQGKGKGFGTLGDLLRDKLK